VLALVESRSRAEGVTRGRKGGRKKVELCRSLACATPKGVDGLIFTPSWEKGGKKKKGMVNRRGLSSPDCVEGGRKDIYSVAYFRGRRVGRETIAYCDVRRNVKLNPSSEKEKETAGSFMLVPWGPFFSTLRREKGEKGGFRPTPKKEGGLSSALGDLLSQGEGKKKRNRA